MSSSNRITKLLQKHKTELSKVNLDPILTHMVKKRVITRDEQATVVAATGDRKVDQLIQILPQKGFNAFREFCVILEMDYPHLLTSLIIESNGMLTQMKKQSILQSVAVSWYKPAVFLDQ